MGAGVEVHEWVFAGGRGWDQAGITQRYNLVLVRSGAFRYRSRGRESIADPTLAWASEPGAEVQTGLLPCGDTLTVVDVAPELWRPFASCSVPVDARMELAHRLLLRAARDADLAFAGVEALGVLMAAGPGRPVPAEPGSRGGALADAAREAILTDHPAALGLVSLARLLGASPFALSRAFKARTGLSLTRYRNRIRVSRALHRLEQGDRDLAGLAADLGFADQAHLTRTMTEHTGWPPGRVRALIGVARA